MSLPRLVDCNLLCWYIAAAFIAAVHTGVDCKVERWRQISKRRDAMARTILLFCPQVSTVDQVDRLFDFIAPLVQDAEGADAVDEPDDEVHIF